MKKLRLALAVAAAACAALVASTTASAQTPFVANLTGFNEVPPRVTIANGTTRLVWTGTTLNVYTTITNLTNMVAGHIHIGPPGVNGPVVLTLFGASPGFTVHRTNRTGFTSSTIVILGSFPATHPLEGPLAGQTVSALIPMMLAGNTYVNFHTNDGIPPTDTGPGDFPGGEIRGQIIPGILVLVPSPPSAPAGPTIPGR